jgi:hypothetical protein
VHKISIYEFWGSYRYLPIEINTSFGLLLQADGKDCKAKRIEEFLRTAYNLSG